MRLTIHKLLVFLIISVFTIVGGAAQMDKDSITLKKIEELYKISRGKYDTTAFINHHIILKEALKIGNVRFEFEGYKSLAWYHGNGHKKERSLDSAMYYFDMFESKMSRLDTVKYSRTLAGHYLNKGNILANRFGLLEPGLNAYYNSYKFLDEEEKNGISAYYTYISQIFSYKNDHKKALEVALPLLKDTSKISLPFKLMYLQNLASLYSDYNQPEKSLEINTEILRLAAKNEYKRDYYTWWTKNEMSNDYYELGNVKRAIDTALVVRKYFEEHTNKEATANNTEYLTAFYYAKGDLDTAISYAEKGLEEEYFITDYPRKYGELASFYMEKGYYEKAKELYRKKDKMNDSIRSIEQKVYTDYANANVKLLREKRKNQEINYNNELLEQKNKRQRLFIVILIIALVSLLLLFAVFKLYKKNKEGREKVKALKANEKKLLEEQIKLRNNELEATVNALSKRVIVLNTLKEQLVSPILSNDQKVKNTSKIITELIDNASDISAVTNKISSRYPSFTSLLKERHPDLSQRDIDYCLLTKLNLSLKETAAILNVSPNTVKVTRSRIKTKMQIPSGTSFKDYLEFIGEEKRNSVAS